MSGGTTLGHFFCFDNTYILRHVMPAGLVYILLSVSLNIIKMEVVLILRTRIVLLLAIYLGTIDDTKHILIGC